MADTKVEESAMAGSWEGSWLVGTALGLYCGGSTSGWHRAGRYEFKVTSIVRQGDGAAVVGSEGGLWKAPRAGADWLQLHDDVLTLVQDVSPLPGDPGVLAATAYGVHRASRDELGALRWRSCPPTLDSPPQLDDCFSTAILVDPDDIQGTAVRALTRAGGLAGGLVWAGTDAQGLLVSSDGESWRPAGEGLAGIPIFDIAHTGEGDVLVGTEEGVMVGDGAGRWQRVGPPIRAAAVAAATSGGQLWLAGGSPGGLWHSEDRAINWRQAAGMPNSVEALAAPRPQVETAEPDG